jgi:uncharacterized membrane protein YeaQ/YmgE (transglycosylase-associated protein family)
MGIVWTLVIGGVVGWLASIIMKANSQMGILANVVVGIIGSYLGLALARAGGVSMPGQIGWWVISIVGAALLIAVLRAVGVFGHLRTSSR